MLPICQPIEVQSSWAADSIEPQPARERIDKATRERMSLNFVEFITEVYLILNSGDINVCNLIEP